MSKIGKVKIGAIVSLMLLATSAFPARAAMQQADFLGQITDIVFDPFGGLSVGDSISGRAVYDDVDISGIPFEDIPYQSLLFNFTSVGTIIEPANTGADSYNTLVFASGSMAGVNVFATVPIGGIEFQYVQNGNATFSLLDPDTLESIVSGEYSLPPASTVPFGGAGTGGVGGSTGGGGAGGGAGSGIFNIVTLSGEIVFADDNPFGLEDSSGPSGFATPISGSIEYDPSLVNPVGLFDLPEFNRVYLALGGAGEVFGESLVDFLSFENGVLAGINLGPALVSEPDWMVQAAGKSFSIFDSGQTSFIDGIFDFFGQTSAVGGAGNGGTGGGNGGGGVNTVPEPSLMALYLVGLVALGVALRKRRVVLTA